MEPRMAKASSRSRFAAGIAFAALALLVHHLGGTRLFIAPHAGETFGIAQRAAKARSALVICAAEATPGAPPVDVEEEEAAASYFKVKMRKKEYTVEQQMTRKERLTERLRKRKGKFVYRGPKPYDPDRFTTVSLQARLFPKQASNTKIMNQIVEELRRITGHHPTIVYSKQNIALFGVRQGDPVGAKVNLEGQLMKDFLQRLNTIILPRVRDFEGLFPNSFDNNGNFWFSLPSQEPFKELDDLVDSRELVHGFQIGILNNCFSQPDALKLMKDFGFPFGDPRPPKVPVVRDPWARYKKKDKKKKR